MKYFACFNIGLFGGAALIMVDDPYKIIVSVLVAAIYTATLFLWGDI